MRLSGVRSNVADLAALKWTDLKVGKGGGLLLLTLTSALPPSTESSPHPSSYFFIRHFFLQGFLSRVYISFAFPSTSPILSFCSVWKLLSIVLTHTHTPGRPPEFFVSLCQWDFPPCVGFFSSDLPSTSLQSTNNCNIITTCWYVHHCHLLLCCKCFNVSLGMYSKISFFMSQINANIAQAQ